MVVQNPFIHDARVNREAAALVEAGHEVTVIAQKAPGHADSETLPDGVQVLRIAGPHQFGLRTATRRLVRSLQIHRDQPVEPSKPVIDARQPGAPDRQTLATLRLLPILLSTPSKRLLVAFKRYSVNRHIARVVASLDPDVIHAHDRDALYACMVGRRRTRSQLVYDAHELEIERAHQSRFQRRWAELTERRWIRHADAVITVSHSIASFLADRYSIALPTVLLNTPSAQADLRPVDLRRLAHLPAGVRVVLYLGALLPNRGLEQLIESARYLQNSAIVLMGPATWYSDTISRAIAAERGPTPIVRLDPCPPELVLSHAAGADVGVALVQDVSLSYRYSLPNKLFEYTLAGVPVIASNLPEIARFIEETGVGEVCDQTDPRSIATTIQQVMDDPALSDQYRRNARLAAATYNWEHEKRKLVGLYARLGPQRGKSR